MNLISVCLKKGFKFEYIYIFICMTYNRTFIEKEMNTIKEPTLKTLYQ